MSATCPGPSCTEQVPSDMLMCRRHWFQVPKDLRQEVLSAWRERLRALEGTQDGTYDAAVDRHKHAKAAAIAAVREWRQP